MTTKVTIEVPLTADYDVRITTRNPILRANFFDFLHPGDTRELYIHNSMIIAGIEEVPHAEQQESDTE